MSLKFETDSTCTYLETFRKSMTKTIPNTLKTMISIYVQEFCVGLPDTMYLGTNIFLKLMLDYFIRKVLHVHHITMNSRVLNLVYRIK